MAITPFLYGGGIRDADLSRADELIRDKQYDEAIQLLSDYIKEHPDNFNHAQKRLQHITKIRDEYNTVADDLLDTMVNNPEDVEKILALIRRLEELESPRNLQVQAFIARTQEVARFTYNRDRLVRILGQGKALVEAGKFQEALQTYAGGLDIYRDEFFASGYGEIIENRVTQGINNVTGGIASFPSMTAPLNAAAAEMAQAGQRPDPYSESNISRLVDIYNRLVPALDQLIAFQQVLYTTASYFDEQLALFQQADNTMGDRSFLSFASRLIRGGAGTDPVDGMAGALEGYWQAVIGGAERAMRELADGAYAAGLLHTVNREYANALPAFESAGKYVRYPLAFIDKRREFREGDKPSEQVLFDQPVLTEDTEIFLKYQSMSRAIGYFIETAKLGNRYERSLETEPASVEAWRQGRISPGEAMRQETVFRGNSGGFLTEIDALLAGINGDRAELRNYQDNFEDPASRQLDVLVYINNADSVIKNFRVRVLDREFESASRFYTIANGEFEKRLTSRKAEYDEGNRLVQGIPRNESGGRVSIDHYPSEGLAILTRLEEEIAADMQAGNGLLDQYAGEREEVLGAGAVNVLYASARTMVDELGALSAQQQRIAAAARTQIAQAETFRLDGDRFFREARNALAQNNFDVARDRVQRATERYNSSLAIQESASLRTEWDTQLVNLGEEINRRENEIVIRDVRSLVNTARNSYFSGDFEQAEDLLVRAQNRWRRTNVGDDSEVLYWLNVVRGALTLRSGRVIPPTAPLYAEMSQLLSDAKKNYDEGVRYLNANRRAAGIAKLAEARRKTQEVKLMFPVNQEARLLELRIEQVTDPEAFNASFDLRFAEAVAGTKRQSPEAFTDLQNLAEINSRYPGMAAALIQAEIDMGYRLPPPDPRDIARSNELTAAARRIIDGNITVQFEVALRQLNEALTLNPNNNQAMIAKDQVQTRMNGTRTIVLDSRSEAEYQRAVSELQRGNTLVALAIVEQLLQDPKNRTSTLILELQRRIQSAL
ncbi:MAG: hypothetical protein LBE14_09195 [Treponema sp.]|jgi:hypothetical protein|nr:hypothetical protein [Treponema sp.]